MGVDHRGRDVRVAEQLLYRSNVVAVLEEVRRERVPHGVRRRALADAGTAHGICDVALDRGLVPLESTRRRQTWIAAQARGGKHELPFPFFAGVWILPLERPWQRRDAIAPVYVPLMGTPDVDKVLDKPWPDEFRQDRGAILLALGAAKDDMATFDVDVLDAQLETLEQAQASAAIHPLKHCGQLDRTLRAPAAVLPLVLPLVWAARPAGVESYARMRAYKQITGRVGLLKALRRQQDGAFPPQVQ